MRYQSVVLEKFVDLRMDESHVQGHGRRGVALVVALRARLGAGEAVDHLEKFGQEMPAVDFIF
jgi:hypothetical protein